MRNVWFAVVAVVCVVSGLATSGRGQESKPRGKTIVELAAGNPEFSTLVVAIQAAGLTEMLSGPGPFTLFAPTNEAFEKLPEKTLEELLKPKNQKKLVDLLTKHVVPGKVRAADVLKLDKAKTVQGHEATISRSKSGLRIDRAKVIQTDLSANNGVIHAIDSVISPKPRVERSSSPTRSAKSDSAKSSSAKSSPAKSSPAKSSPVKSSPAKSSPAKSSPAKSSATQSSTAKSSAAKSSPEKASPAKSGSTKGSVDK